MREISEKYRLQLAEFDDALAKELTAGRLRVFDSIRIGAASAVRVLLIILLLGCSVCLSVCVEGDLTSTCHYHCHCH